MLGRIAIVAALLVGACRGAARLGPEPVPSPTAWLDADGHRNGRVAVDRTYIHYVDYGGTGAPLVLLAALGNSAHVFDAFAPRLAGRWHVVALTRRGYGESGRPPDGYETPRLAEDVVAVLDSLHIARAVLVGHGEAGDELIALAASHPERVAALVFLEAAYDHSARSHRLIASALADRLPPSPPRATARDRASPEAYREYLARITGVSWPMSEVRATRVFDADGSYRREATDGRIAARLVRSARSPNDGAIRAPVLAVYATERGVERDYPWLRELGPARSDAADRAAAALRDEESYAAADRRRLARALPSACIVTIAHASRYVFLSNADEVEAEIRRFASEIR